MTGAPGYVHDAVRRAMQTIDERQDDIGEILADRDADYFVCPVCRGLRTIQPDRCTPPEQCPRCVDPDEGA